MGEAERLVAERERVLRRVAGVREFLRGSVVLMQRRCAQRRCPRCAAGGRHPTWVLTVSERGKTRTVYLGAGRAERARRMAVNYRPLQAWIEAAARINERLLVGRRRPRAKGAGDGPRVRGP